MTVMPSSSDVADKAVSTEDASSGVEVARLEAVLAALVETKVEAIKASTSATRAGSAPASPRRPRLTSSSTGSSSQNNHHHHHHHHGHHGGHHGHHHHHGGHHGQHRHRQEKKGQRHRRHGSAPCGDYIEDPVTHRHKQRHGKGKQKLSESPRAGRKRRRQSRSPQPLGHSRALDSRFELLDGTELTTGDPAAGTDIAAFLNLERMREALSDVAVSGGGDYPGLHQSACYISHSTAQLKSHYDDEDYLSFTFADDCEEDESFSGGGVGLHNHHTLPPRSSRSARDHRFHRPRKKRKQQHRKRQRARQHLVDDVEVELGVDPDDLPPRARWTIVATACLLLAMSLLLVGVTLRMAPIIDEMVVRFYTIFQCYWHSTMDLPYPSHRLSTSSEEQSIFYIDDPVPAPDCLLSPERPTQPNHLIPRDEHSTFDIGTLADLHPSPRPRSSYNQRRRNSSVSSQCSGGGTVGRPRRHRRPSEFVEGSGRRASMCPGGPGRPRSGSCARVTPLGDGRRASLCKPGPRPSGQRSRRASSAGRRDSVRPSRSDADRSPSVCFTPVSITEASLIKEPHEIERQRRHRRIALVLLVTFGFILVASVLAVVVTLTHSSFYKPPTGSRELAEHRAAHHVIMDGSNRRVRKENEELLNSLNRESTPENVTTLLQQP